MSEQKASQPNNFQRPGGGPRGHGGGRGGPIVKPKNFTGTLKRLWRYFGNERKILSTILIFIVVDSLITLSAPYLIGKSIDAMTIGGKVDFGLLKMTILVLLIAYVADGILTFLQGWLMAGVSQRIVKRLRSNLFKKLQKLPVSFFDTRTHGELMSRLSNDIDNVSNTISQSTTQLMSGGIVLIGSLIMMLILSPVLTLASLVTVPLVFLLTRTIAKKTRVLFKNQQIQLGKLNGHIEETISGIQVVKAFNHEDKSD